LGTESLQIHGFFSIHDKLSALWSHVTWPDYSCIRNCAIWGFERWSSLASLPVYFWLRVQAIRCCSHLARPYDVFHSWGGKTDGTLIDRSCDAQPESGETSEVVTSAGVKKYDQSHIFQSVSGMWPKLRIRLESRYTYIISMYNM
jgi:hypothetical protein